jgi:hypothetical protein
MERGACGRDTSEFYLCAGPEGVIALGTPSMLMTESAMAFHLKGTAISPVVWEFKLCGAIS